jgi:flagellar biosynthesis protein FlhF
MEHLLTDAGLGEDCGETPNDAAVHLVLPPQYSGPELRVMLDRYRSSHAGSFIWTKLDEAEHYGQIVNAGNATGRPISAFSFGPGLGGTLSPARAQALWRLLFKKEMPK